MAWVSPPRVAKNWSVVFAGNKVRDSGRDQTAPHRFCWRGRVTTARVSADENKRSGAQPDPVRVSHGPQGGPALDSRDMNSSTASGTTLLAVPRPCLYCGAPRHRDLDSKRPYDGGPLGRSAGDAHLVITAAPGVNSSRRNVCSEHHKLGPLKIARRYSRRQYSIRVNVVFVMSSARHRRR